MTKCDYCGSTILFGGKRDSNGRFCNQKYQARGALLAISRQLPEAVVQEHVWKAHQAPAQDVTGQDRWMCTSATKSGLPLFLQNQPFIPRL